MTKKTKIVIIIAIPLMLVLATANYFNRDTYVAEPQVIVELSNEEKLTNFLSEKMVEQKNARVLEQRAFEALQEAVELRTIADEEVDAAIENIKTYQGIE